MQDACLQKGGAILATNSVRYNNLVRYYALVWTLRMPEKLLIRQSSILETAKASIHYCFREEMKEEAKATAQFAQATVDCIRSQIAESGRARYMPRAILIIPTEASKESFWEGSVLALSFVEPSVMVAVLP